MSLTCLREAIDSLFDSAPSLCDAESVVAFHRELSRLEALVTEVTSDFDSSGKWADVGARSCALYLSTKTHLPTTQLRSRVSLGRKLKEMPCAKKAFSDGEISVHHARVISSAQNHRTKKHFERDEEMLVSCAKELSFGEFCSLVSYWKQHADPDGCDEAAEKRRSRRDVFVEASYDGMFFGKLVLDPISGSIVKTELDRLKAQLFQADWKEALQRLGREPAPFELSRCPQQRRADALVEMATRSGTAFETGRRPAPLFSVLVDFHTLAGRVLELSNGTVLAPSDISCWLTRAEIERAVFLPDRRVEVGKKSRLFTGATRRAIELRDRRCTHAYCEEPLEACEVDHIVPYAKGGPTTQENGRLLCGFHNRLRLKKTPPDS